MFRAKRQDRAQSEPDQMRIEDEDFLRMKISFWEA